MASHEHEKAVYELVRWIEGMEDGSMHLSDALVRAKELEPVAVFLMIRFLREKHKNAETASPHVLARVVELSSMYPEFIKICKSGEKDAMSEWFMDEYKFSEFFHHPDKMAEIIVEKMES